MTNKLAPLALPLGAALLLAGQAMAAPVAALKHLGREAARIYCSDTVQAELVGATPFARGQVASFIREQLGEELGYELTAVEKGRVSALVRELTLGGYCEPGSI